MSAVRDAGAAAMRAIGRTSVPHRLQREPRAVALAADAPASPMELVHDRRFDVQIGAGASRTIDIVFDLRRSRPGSFDPALATAASASPEGDRP